MIIIYLPIFILSSLSMASTDLMNINETIKGMEKFVCLEAYPGEINMQDIKNDMNTEKNKIKSSLANIFLKSSIFSLAIIMNDIKVSDIME